MRRYHFLGTPLALVVSVALLVAASTVSAHAAPTPKGKEIARADKAPAIIAPPARQFTTVPFTPWRNHGGPIVEVRFDDTHTGRFLLDTGASMSMMSESCAKRLGLKLRPAIYNADTGGAISMDSDHGAISEYVDVKRMILGNFDIGKVQFIVLHGTDMLDRGEEPIDGLIGGPFIASSALLIDYPHNTFTFIFPGGLTSDEIDQVGLDTAVHVPFRLLGEGTYAVQDEWQTEIHLKSGEHTATQEVSIDTGASHTSLSQRTATLLGLGGHNKTGISTPGSGSSYMTVTQVPEVQIGDLTVHDLAVVFPGRAGAPEIPTLLGENLLSSCTALFDFPKRQLYLKPVLPPVASLGAAPIDPASIDRARLQAAAAIPYFAYSVALAQSDKPAFSLDTLWREDASMAKDPTETYDQAVDRARAQVQASPKDVTALSRLAVALVGAGKEDEAEHTARQATAAQPDAPAVWLALGWALHARSLRVLTGEARSVIASTADDHAFQELVARLKKTPPSADQIRQALALSREAKECFDKTVSIAPQAGKSYIERVAFRQDDGLGVQAVVKALEGTLESMASERLTQPVAVDLEAADSLSQDDVDTLRQAAMAASYGPLNRNQRGIDLRGGKYWRSLPAKVRAEVQGKLDQLEGIAGGSDKTKAARALEALGILRANIVEDYPLAEKTLLRALALDPDRAEASFALVDMMREQRRYVEIVTFLTNRLQSRDCALDRLLLARALDRLGRSDEALTQVDKAVALSPASLTANLTQAALLIRDRGAASGGKEHLADAGACLDRIATLDEGKTDASGNADYDNLRAIYLSLTGNTAQAMKLALGTLATRSTNTQAREIIAALLVPPAPATP